VWSGKYHCFVESQCLHLQSTGLLDNEYEMLVTNYWSTWWYIPQDWNLQQHNCENLLCHITQALLLGRKSFLSNVCKISAGFLFPQSLFYDLFRAFCQFDISWQKCKNILMPAKTLQINLIDNTKKHTSIKIYTFTYSPLILQHVLIFFWPLSGNLISNKHI